MDYELQKHGAYIQLSVVLVYFNHYVNKLLVILLHIYMHSFQNYNNEIFICTYIIYTYMLLFI